MNDKARGASLIEGYRPGIIGRIVELHGMYYAREWGVGAEFESLMAREVCDFIEGYDPGRDLLLSAAVAGRVVGTIAILRPDRAATPRGCAGSSWIQAATDRALDQSSCRALCASRVNATPGAISGR